MTGATADRPVRLASVGLGWWGEVLADAATRTGEVEIVAAFARSGSSRRAFAERHGCAAAGSFDEVLADPDVDGVLLATPHGMHREQIEAAAAARKHVFVEKPFTLCVADAERAVAAADAAGVVLQVGHHRRREPATRRLHDLVADGAIGHVSLLESNFSGPGGVAPREGWREDPAERPLGGMTGMGVHMVDNLVYLAGRPRTVTALSRRTLGRSNLDDVTIVAIEFDSGALGYVGTSQVIPRICTTAVYGSAGAAWSEEDGARLYVQDAGESSRREVPVEGPHAVTDQLAEFVRCVRTGAVPEVDGRQATEVVAVLEGAGISRDRRATVDLDELRQPPVEGDRSPSK